MASTAGLPWFKINVTKREHAILYLGLSIIDQGLPPFYLPYNVSLSKALKKAPSHSRLSRRLNSVNITIVNTCSVKAIFPVTTHLIYHPILVPFDFDLNS
jgi:hypothetical protein